MKVGELFVSLGAKTKGLEDGLQRAKNSLKKTQREMKRVGQSMQQIGGAMSTYVTLPIAAAGVAALRSAAEMEQLEKGLKALMGSSAAASDELDKLKEAAQNPGLGFQQAVRGSLALQAVGFEAEFARDALLQFGNALALSGGTADDLQEVIRQLSQVQSLGKITAENMNVIRERVPLVGRALQEAFGTSSIEQIRETGISTDEFVKRLVEGLGSIERAEGGLANSFENLKIAITSASAEIGQAINNTFDIQGIIDGVSSAISSLVERFNALSKPIRQAIIAFAGIAALLGPLLVTLGTLSVILGSLSAPILAVVAGATALGAAAAVIYANWEGVAGWFASMWEAVKAIFQGYGTAIVGVLKTFFLSAADQVTEFIAGQVELYRKLFDVIGAEGIASRIEAFQDSMRGIIPASEVRDAAGQVQDGLASARDGMRDFYGGFETAGAAIMTTSQDMADSVVEAVDKIRNATSGGGGGAGAGSGSGFDLKKISKVSTRRGLDDFSTGPAFEGASVSVDKYISKVTQAASQTRVMMAQIGEVVRGMGVQALNGLSRAVGDVTYGLLTGADGVKTLGDAFKELGRLAKRVLADIAAQLAQMAAQKLLFSVFGSALSIGTGGAAAPLMALGGMMASRMPSVPAGGGTVGTGAMASQVIDVRLEHDAIYASVKMAERKQRRRGRS